MLEINIITERLEKIGISYCIVGGLAAIAYGRPRLTLDADIVIALKPPHVKDLVAAFPIEDFYLPPEEVLHSEIQRESRGHFNIIHQHSALRADCYLPGHSALAKWELANRVKIAGPFGNTWFAPPEAVILNKLIFFREGGSQKHIDDITAMIDAGTIRDRSELLRWVDELDLNQEWKIVSNNQ